MSNFPPSHETDMSPQDRVALEVQRIFWNHLTLRSSERGTYIKEPDYKTERAHFAFQLEGQLPASLDRKEFWTSTDGSILKYKEDKPFRGISSGPAHISLIMFGRYGLRPIEEPLTDPPFSEEYAAGFQDIPVDVAKRLGQLLADIPVLQRHGD